MIHVVNRYATQDSVIQRLNHFLVILEGGHRKSAERTAVFVGDDDILRHVNQTTGQVAGVSGLQRGIGKTLTGTVRGDEVLENRQSFLEVGKNRVLDDLSAGCRFFAAWP